MDAGREEEAVLIVAHIQSTQTHQRCLETHFQVHIVISVSGANVTSCKSFLTAALMFLRWNVAFLELFFILSQPPKSSL